MDIFATYATDESKEENGVWMELGDAKLLIARSGNPKYTKIFEAAYKKNKRLLDRADEAADELAKKLFIDATARSVLLGWENVSFQGQPMTYSVENAKILLGHKDFYNEVTKMSQDLTAYKMVQDEDVEKN